MIGDTAFAFSDSLPEWFPPMAMWIGLGALVLGMVGAAAYAMMLKRKSRLPEKPHTKKFRTILLWASPSLAILGVILMIVGARIRVALLTSEDLTNNLVWTLLAILLIFGTAHVLRNAIQRAPVNLMIKHKTRRAIMVASSLIFITALVIIWASSLEGLGAFFGLVAAGIALSLQEVILCVVGWMLIALKKPYDIGDRIEINGTIGDVIDIRLFQTHLLEVGNWVEADQSTGRIVHMPNSAVFRGKVSNYTKGFPFIWNELKTVITFNSDMHTAKEIILRQAQEEAEKIENEVRRQISRMQREYAISYQHFSPITYTNIEAHGIALTLRYLTPVRMRRETTSKICEGILEEFAKNDTIALAYPSQTIYAEKLTQDRQQ